MATTDRRDREKYARRLSILDAAEPLVYAHGFAAMKMEDVAKAAELSKGTLYLYFQNKSALCAAIAERNLATLFPQIEAAVAEQTRGLDRVRAQYTVVAEYMVTKPEIIRLMVGWLLEGSGPDTDNPSFQAYRARVADMQRLATMSFEAGKADGSIRSDLDTMVTGLQLWGAMIGNLLLIASQEEIARRLPVPIDISGSLKDMVEMIVRGIAAPGVEKP